jgi:hypothetical protein
VLKSGKYMSIDRQEPLQNLGLMVARIRATGETGRLALRNTARMGTLHLYFERGQLVHVVGNRASTDDALIDLAGWSQGLIRFDAGVLPERQTVTPTQQEFFQRTILLMQQHGILGAAPQPTAQFPAHSPTTAPLHPPLWSSPEMTPERLPITQASPQWLPERQPPVIDASLSPRETRQPAYKTSSRPLRSTSGPVPGFPPAGSVVSGTAEVLLSSRQWELLVEVMHTLVESVGQLFGQQQAQNILQHALAERGGESGVLRLLQVDRHGWLREVQLHEMLAQPVREVAAAFVLLIGDFERRCTALLGEEKARQMIARALYPYHDGLAEIGIALN